MYSNSELYFIPKEFQGNHIVTPNSFYFIQDIVLLENQEVELVAEAGQLPEIVYTEGQGE